MTLQRLYNDVLILVPKASYIGLKWKSQPTGQIYVRGIFVEHSLEIFPVYSEKIPSENLRNIPKKCSENIEYSNIS